MDRAELKSFDKPEEVREFPKGRVELVNIAGATVGRVTCRSSPRVTTPGWWATNRRSSSTSRG